MTVLHTWGQNQLHHPHVHCVIPGGGIAPDGERWITCRPGFFLPVRVLSRLFRRLFLEQLRRAFDAGALRLHGQLEPLREPQAFAAWLAPAAHVEWVVYAKPPFGGAAQVLDYLGRYTHRVAISNNRLLRFDGDSVLFQWKDYRHEARHSTMTLTADEFIRRFLLHVLPDGFKRIRSYGWLANCHRAARLATCRRLLGVEPPVAAPPAIKEDYRDRYQRLTGRSLRDCPVCGKGPHGPHRRRAAWRHAWHPAAGATRSQPWTLTGISISPQHVGLPPRGQREPARALASSPHHNAAKLRTVCPLIRAFPLVSRNRLSQTAHFRRAMATRRLSRITAPFIQCP
ncbi:hypothetical protein OKW40_001771 [Paraburkholderia sp. RAU6.4a]